MYPPCVKIAIHMKTNSTIEMQPNIFFKDFDFVSVFLFPHTYMYNQYFWMWRFKLKACQNGQNYKLHNKTYI